MLRGIRRSREKFWARTHGGPGNCISWTGPLYNGYGSFSGRSASRFAYEQFYGPIPEGLQIDHLCRNRSCVNPDHLEAVTPRVNLNRAGLALMKTHCAQGHKFTNGNTYHHPAYRGRQCGICRRMRVRESYWRKKEARLAAGRLS